MRRTARRASRWFLLGLSMLAAADLSGLPSYGQIRNCGKGGGSRFTVHVDDLAWRPDRTDLPDGAEDIRSPIEFRLLQELEAISLRYPYGQLAILRCYGRRVSQAAELNSDILKDLDRHNVVLETWGNLQGQFGSGVITDWRGSLSALIVPAMEASELGWESNTFVYSMSLPRTNRLSKAKKIFPELEPIIEFALTLKYSGQLRSEDEVISTACRTIRLIDRLPTALPESEQKLLAQIRSMAADIASRVVTVALASEHYKGIYRLLPTGQTPCSNTGGLQ